MENNEDTVERLLNDPSFRQWILSPTSELDIFWSNWLKQDFERKHAVKQATIILKSLRFDEGELSGTERSLLLKKIKYTNALGEQKKSGKAVVRPIYNYNSINDLPKRRKRTSINYFLRYAAILGGAVIFAFSMNYFLKEVNNNEKIQLLSKTNKSGQKSTIYLSDGSVVTLNSSSKLIYPKEFKGEVREVKLEGEAFFKVASDSKPFILKTNNLEAKVLGTSFNVRAFSDNEHCSVSLVTGKVEVYPSNKQEQHLILHPGEKATLTLETKTLRKSDFNYDEEILWKDGILFFNKTPFREAIDRMEKWYGVKFNVDQMPGQNYLVTGKFDNESLESVLRSISFTIRFDYKARGNTVNIKFKK